MIADVFVKALRVYCRRKPFRQFVLEFSNSAQLTIGHPESIVIRNDLVVYLAPNSLYQLFDASSVLRLIDVANH